MSERKIEVEEVNPEPDHKLKINGYSYNTVTMELSVVGEIEYCKYKEQVDALQARIDEATKLIREAKEINDDQSEYGGGAWVNDDPDDPDGLEARIRKFLKEAGKK